MKRKKASALASLSIILLASIALFAPIPPVSAQPKENHRYWVLGGMAMGCSHLTGEPPTYDWKTPFQTRPPDFWPLWGKQNITFSDKWELPGYGFVVNLTVPTQNFTSLEHSWFDKGGDKWYKLKVYLEENGTGWIFLNDNRGDIDCYTYNDNDGVWWEYPSPNATNKAADTGALPSPGPDGVAGTADDGFGDGTNDTRGSSILLLPTKMRVHYWDNDLKVWIVLIDSPWPQVFTTGTAYDIVKEPESLLDGWNSTETGQPWEFLAGLDHPGNDKIPHTDDPNEYEVEYDHPKWNAYVTYVCAWSVLDYPSSLGDLDVIFQVVEKKVRDDCLISDVTCDEKVTITDIVIAALAFGAEDEGAGEDGTPETADDKKDADPHYDARGDFAEKRGKITITDIVIIALDFGAYISPDCVIRP